MPVIFPARESKSTFFTPGASRYPALRASSTWFSKLKNFPHKYPVIWNFIKELLKWLVIGAIAATILYFTGGLAALPFLGKLGAGAIPAAMLPLAAIKAVLWYSILRPLLKCFGFGAGPELALPGMPANPGPRSRPADTRAQVAPPQQP